MSKQVLVADANSFSELLGAAPRNVLNLVLHVGMSFKNSTLVNKFLNVR